MRAQAITNTRARFSPLDPQSQSLAWKAGAVLIGGLFLALSSRIEVPMVPVPITMQTFAVMLVGALYGWRLGATTVLTWLGAAAMGLPLLASGKFGLAPFAGPTAGYLFAFPLAAALTGWLAERGWNGNRMGLAGLAMLAGNLLCLLLGAAWLAQLVGTEAAITAGVTPFLLGAVLKSVLGAMVLRLMTRGPKRQA